VHCRCYSTTVVLAKYNMYVYSIVWCHTKKDIGIHWFIIMDGRIGWIEVWKIWKLDLLCCSCVWASVQPHLDALQLEVADIHATMQRYRHITQKRKQTKTSKSINECSSPKNRGTESNVLELKVNFPCNNIQGRQAKSRLEGKAATRWWMEKQCLMIWPWLPRLQR